jgi:DNA polymerase V
MVDEVATELVSRKLCCQLISIGIGYSKAVGGGFSRQMTLDIKTNSQKKLMEAFLSLYYKHVQDYPIRRIDVRVGKLSLEEFMQPDLFEGPDAAKKEHDLYEAIGKIKDKYGKNAVHLAVSNTEKSTYIKRNTLIGGHNAE